MKQSRPGRRTIGVRGRTLGVFGGSFDPPHLGHVLLPALLRARSSVDHLIVAPCADHPLGKTMSGFERRLGWVRLAMRQHGTFVGVSDLEDQLAREHGGPSFTLRLLEAVADANPGAHVRLVVGSDIARSGQVARWHRWDEIEARFAPLVVPRSGYAPPDRCALPEVSSSQVRQALEAGDWPAVARLVPAAVAAAIRAPRTGTVAVVGRGNVSAHAVPWLIERGFAVEVVSGRAAAAGTAVLSSTDCAGVWVLVPDPAIADVAAGLARGGLPAGIPVLHASGARIASDVLGALGGVGHPVGVLHPICALRRELPWPSPLWQATFGIGGAERALAFARTLVGDQATLSLVGQGPPERAAYHGACALVANHVAVLLASGQEVLDLQGHPADKIDAALAVLLRSATENLTALGVPAGVTGPVARGDDRAVAAHVAALPPDAAELYATLSDRLRALLRRTPMR